MRTEIVKITPEMAEELLLKNGANRNVRKSIVARYARDMVAGNWHLGGGTIDVDTAGRLMNGQHRLYACIEAGVPFESVVNYGVSAEAMTVMDVGVKRALSDLLAWKGEVQVHALGAAINFDWRWRRGQLTSNLSLPSHHEALEHLARNPSLRDALRRGNAIRHSFRIPQAPLACFAFHTGQYDMAESDAFCQAWLHGENLRAGSPILALRNWLTGHLSRTGTPSRVLYHAIVIKAWNAYIQGNSLRMLAWKRGGLVREEFPVLLDAEGEPIPLEDELGGAND